VLSTVATFSSALAQFQPAASISLRCSAPPLRAIITVARQKYNASHQPDRRPALIYAQKALSPDGAAAVEILRSGQYLPRTEGAERADPEAAASERLGAYAAAAAAARSETVRGLVPWRRGRCRL
jgi:hypothetical protein